MSTAIIVVFLLLIFSVVVRFSRKLLYDDFTYDLNDDDFRGQIGRLCEGMRLPERRGAGVDVTLLKGVTNKAFNIIKKKVRQGKSLFEYEKWLYDNNYLIKRYLSLSVFDSFFKLPHIDDAPRIITLARKTVAFSGGKLSASKIQIALDEINKVSPLTIDEINNFKLALIFALLEKIASVSKKCVYYNRLFKLAVKAKNLAKKYIKSNIYVYYTLKNNPKLAVRLKSYLKQNGENYDNVDYAFSALIIENNVLTENLIKSVKQIDDFCKLISGSLKALAVLNSDAIFKNMDEATKELYLAQISKQSQKLNVDEVTFCGMLLELQLLFGKHFGVLLFDHKRAIVAYAQKHITINLEKKKDKMSAVYCCSIFAVAAVFGVISAFFVFQLCF